MQESALLIAVEEAEHLVGLWCAAYDGAARCGVPAHVTILYPFVEPGFIDDDVIALIRSVTATRTPFHFTLVAPRRFNDKVLYLAPSPEQLFRELCDTFYALFPDHPPYGGQHDDVIPHLTVADEADARTLDEAERAVASGLPVECVASEILLMAGSTEVDSWRILQRFPFAAT